MQLSLFDTSCEQETIPNFIKTVLDQGANLAISVSGGKDSDAMLRFLVRQYQEHSWKGKLFGLFCDLGRIEWLGVSEHLNRLFAALNVSLISLYPTRPMIEEWQRRRHALIAKHGQS